MRFGLHDSKRNWSYLSSKSPLWVKKKYKFPESLLLVVPFENSILSSLSLLWRWWCYVTDETICSLNLSNNYLFELSSDYRYNRISLTPCFLHRICSNLHTLERRKACGIWSYSDFNIPGPECECMDLPNLFPTFNQQGERGGSRGSRGRGGVSRGFRGGGEGKGGSRRFRGGALGGSRGKVTKNNFILI